MIARLKSAYRAVLAYLSDVGHRRFVAMLVAMISTHLLGKALDADSVALMLEVVIGGVALHVVPKRVDAGSEGGE